ncbi:MAG: transcription-repair coupling factor [Verrucomicrobia bacterium]|nr:MAG: transcription-repair coupling factor [Verrucomicrobiota bacterium]
MQRTFSPAEWRQRRRRLRVGDTLDPLDLVEWLEEQGYEPEAQVTQKSTLALRGGIVDVFPPARPWPVRIEFFGNTIESLREFDPATQLARATLDEAILSPAGELGLLRRQVESGANTAGPGGPPTLMDHLPEDALVVVCEPEAVRQAGAEAAGRAAAGSVWYRRWEEITAQWRARGRTLVALAELPVDALPEAGLTAPEEDGLLKPVELPVTSLETWRPSGGRAPDPAVAEARRREFLEQIHRWQRRGWRVEVMCNNRGEADRFLEIWAEEGPQGPAARKDGRREVAPAPPIRLGPLGHGFVCERLELAVVTDAEIFGRYKHQRPRRLKSPHAAAARSVFEIGFTDFEPGDYVVHIQHGIGRFLGIERLESSDSRRAARECLVIEYAPRRPDQDPPRLYVPLTEAHLVSKYVGAGRARPPLSVLGDRRWQRAKEAAAQAVQDLAAELLSIQAARQSQPGYAFPPDTPWQREFENAFIYEETPDQLAAIEATRRDMEAPKPMDRLICGDVGFGKTEVAIRAAFKAVMAGRQVAVLTPTTVLAQQHYRTFSERMADYPVRVELLSRFRTPRQQAEVLRGLASGAVDIVIGTHRLLSDDVRFRDLGLVVIDEEQRFGVLHKERFKQMRRMVDVLTLSATPIPRTLYLALTGARDLSTIETPPQDRLPVETIVAAYDERLIREAIRRELVRGGQTFFLHNRIHDIHQVAGRIRALVPEARVVVGHGQMKSDELEAVMTRFIEGEADVLVSTTIIESGIDIPNANTLIIDRADRFGLSDLYQLRGRVGRYNRQAYAYLLIPRHAGLLADARRRISAIRQFSTPGSGFKIAMRDLEIRGAGNLLGKEQSGHITAVGFDLYCQLLKETIHALKGEPLKPPPRVNLRFDFLEIGGLGLDGAPEAAEAPVASPEETTRRSGKKRSRRGAACSIACLPPAYVSEPQHRIELYRRLALCTEGTEIDALEAEIRDRFGPLPEPARLLIEVARLRLLAAERRVESIEVRDDKLMITRGGDYLMVGGRFPRLTAARSAARLKEIVRLLRALQ